MVVTATVHVLARLLGALFSPVQDCDEVFNYWEPTHFLTHGYGLKTWENTSLYALRTYAYSGLHALALMLLRPVARLVYVVVADVAPFSRTLIANSREIGAQKYIEFYMLRVVLALLSFTAENALIQAVQLKLGQRTARYTRFFLALSPGMFHAAPALLPSSLVMYTSTYAFALIVKYSHHPSSLPFLQIIFWFTFGIMYGWPFAGALALPWSIYQLSVCARMLQSRTFKQWRSVWQHRILGTIAIITTLSLPPCVIDYFFYKRFMFVPIHIVLYNMPMVELLLQKINPSRFFSTSNQLQPIVENHGPELYGTESWHFYILNGALNFNIVWILLLVTPLLSPTAWRNFNLLAPLLIWLAIFTRQPHKEERFLFPIYPLICTIAAICVVDVLNLFNGWSITPPTTTTITTTTDAVKSENNRPIESPFARLLRLGIISSFILISISRTIALVRYYGAPLDVYTWLSRHHTAQSHETNVCVGKEWHRFPSTFFLPHNTHLKFLKSHFDGLLPGVYQSVNTPIEYDLLHPQWTFQQQWTSWKAVADVADVDVMRVNNVNREEMDHYTHISDCSYVVDSELSSHTDDTTEPNFGRDIVNGTRFEKVYCVPFLDNQASTRLRRILWIPSIVSDYMGNSASLVWGQYCVYQQKI